MTGGYPLTAALRVLPGHLALGGGGFAHWIVRLFIWHELWRLGRALWRIPVFGPPIVIVVVLGLVTLAVLRQRNGYWWPRRRRGGSMDTGSGPGPRDW